MLHREPDEIDGAKLRGGSMKIGANRADEDEDGDATRGMRVTRRLPEMSWVVHNRGPLLRGSLGDTVTTVNYSSRDKYRNIYSTFPEGVACLPGILPNKGTCPPLTQLRRHKLIRRRIEFDRPTPPLNRLLFLLEERGA